MSIPHDRLTAALPAYRVGGEIGRGGFGTVWAGEHKAIGRPVAIKQLSTDTADVRARFRVEAKVLASMEHPHIVRLYDYVEDEDMCVLVMERLHGGTLADRMAAGTVDLSPACAVAMAMCAALHHAHGRGVLHRDVTPRNVLFAADGVVKISDFGIAKVVTGGTMSFVTTGGLVGTPAYMAPEQIRGEELGPGVDVYATGVVLYQLLAGTLPFSEQGGPVAVALRHITDSPAPVRRIAPHVSEALAEVAMVALGRTPAERFASAEDLGVAVGRAANAALGAGWLDAAANRLIAPGPILDSAHSPEVRDDSRRLGRPLASPAPPPPAPPPAPVAPRAGPPPPAAAMSTRPDLADSAPTEPLPPSAPTEPAPTLPDPPRRPNRTVFAVAALAVVAAAIGSASWALSQGGGGSPKSSVVTTGPPETTATTVPPTTLPPACVIALGPLPAGTCRTSRFLPPFVRTVNAGWTVNDPETSDVIEFARGGNLVTIASVTRVFDPANTFADTNAPTDPVPPDLIAWLSAHPRLHTSAPVAVTVDGIAATQVDVEVTKPYPCSSDPKGCVDLIKLGPEVHPVIPIGGLETTRIIAFHVRGATIAVLEEADQPADFAAFVVQAQEIVSTIHFTGVPVTGG